MTTNRFRVFLAQQLGFPSGWFGQLLLRLLNRNNASMNDLVLQVLALQAGDRILEIGFGGGDLLQKMVATKLPTMIVGVERSADAVTHCQRRFRAEIAQGIVQLHLADATALPSGDRQFTHLCTVNTLYFWENPHLVLAECHRVLLPNGKLVISYASKACLDQQQLLQHGFIAYEAPEVEALLSAAGFTKIATVTGSDAHHDTFFCTYGVKEHG